MARTLRASGSHNATTALKEKRGRQPKPKSIDDPDVEMWLCNQISNYVIRGFNIDRACRIVACEVANERPDIELSVCDYKKLLPLANKIFHGWRGQDEELKGFKFAFSQALVLEMMRVAKEGITVRQRDEFGEVVLDDKGKPVMERIPANFRVALEAIRTYAELNGFLEIAPVQTPVVSHMVGCIDTSLLQHVPQDVIDVANEYANEIRASAALAVRRQSSESKANTKFVKEFSRKIG